MICRYTPALVEAEIALEEIEAAAADAARASSLLAPEIGLAGTGACAGRAQALVALARENYSRAAALALRAAVDAESIGAAVEGARSRVVAGRALAATDRDAALRELTEAERQASESGARRVRDEAVRELRRLGRRVGRGGRRAAGDQAVCA